MGKGRRNREQRRAQAPVSGGYAIDVSGLSEKAQGLLAERYSRNAALLSSLDVDELPAAIEKRRLRILALCDGFDAREVIAHLARSLMPMVAERHVESEATGGPADVELLAAVLLAGPEPQGPPRNTVVDGNLMTPLGEALSELLGLLVLAGYASVARDVDADPPELHARARAAAYALWTRGPGFDMQERATLSALFSADRVAEDLRDTLGFGVDDALACSTAIQDILGDRHEQRMLRARALAAEVAAGQRPEELDWAEKVLDGLEKLPPDVRGFAVAMIWSSHGLGGWLTVDASEIADRAQVGAPVAAAFLERFTQGFGDAPEDPRRGMEAVRDRPFIARGEGRVTLTAPGAEVWAMRPAFEHALVDAGERVRQRYHDHRAAWLEERAGALLAGALNPDEVHRSLQYTATGTDENGRPMRVEGEIDVLLRLDDVLVVVEAKSATVPAGGRRGGRALVQHLRKHLTKAAEQGQRAREALLGGEVEFRDASGDVVELGGERAREIHPVVVTLDDLSMVAPSLWELVGGKVLPEGITVPWVITLHDLELVCLLVEHPPQLVHFLRRRARFNQRGGRWATDELDLWMLYLRTSLYIEEDPRELVRYASLTDPLDQWYFGEQGLRDPAPKPRQELDEDTVAALNFLSDNRPPGWVAAACSLLDSSSLGRTQLWTRRQQMRKDAAARQCVQRYSHHLDPLGVLVALVVVPDADRHRLQDALWRYVDERVTEADELGRVIGIGLTAHSPRPIDALLVIEPGVWELPSSPSS